MHGSNPNSEAARRYKKKSLTRLSFSLSEPAVICSLSKM
jgi:hypothetical protein